MPPRVIFMGSPEFAIPSLSALCDAGYEVAAVYTQPDRPAGRGQHLHPSPVKEEALRREIPVLQPASLRGEEAHATFAALKPDLAVVAAFGLLIPPAIIDTPAHGILNVHASLLPRHRGAAPVPGAILAGDSETGVTIMQIDPGLDTGPMLARARTPIANDDTTGSLLVRLGYLGAALLLETLPGWLAGRIAPEPQDGERATVCPRIEKRDATIDWNKPARLISREVRAYNPWPLAHTMLAGERLAILEALPFDRATPEPAGTVVPLADATRAALGHRAAGAGFGVATGNGTLVPLRVQRAGKAPVDAAAFARGQRDLLGSVLGTTVATS